MKKKIIYIGITVGVLAFVIYFFNKKSKDIMKDYTDNKMIPPVTGRISSKFGNRNSPKAGASSNHNGVDIAVPIGTSVKSPADGTVVDVFQNASGGKQLLIDHFGGYRTGYAHLSEQLVSKGYKVKQGELIAKSGNTGNSTGPHLHFTVRKNGELIDPESIFNFA